jgi:hypothetical protein
MGNMSFALGAPAIVSEVIDGEAIIIDMRSGNYFSTEALGAKLWLAALAGHDRQTLLASMIAAYPDAAEVGTDADTFLNLLVSNGLLVETASGGSGADASVWPIGAYVRPELHQHSDMQDLIMLDPIHDVDTMGWPTRREDTAPFHVS